MPEGQISSGKKPLKGRNFMILNWAAIFLILALIAAFFGFGGIATESANMARILFGIFCLLFLIAVVANFLGYPLKWPF